MGKIQPWIAAALVMLAAAFFMDMQAGTAQAALKHIDGRCGIHRGTLVFRNKIHEEFKARIGVKNGTSGGSHRCHGKYVRKGTRGISWSSFDFTRWNWHGIIDVAGATTITTVACAGFAAAFAGEFPTGGLDTAGTAAAGAGCVGGASLIRTTVNNDFYARK